MLAKKILHEMQNGAKFFKDLSEDLRDELIQKGLPPEFTIRQLEYVHCYVESLGW